MRVFTRGLAAFTLILALITVLVTVRPLLDQETTELSPVAAVPQRATVLGYERQELFGGWLTGVREEVVARAGDLDPYSGEALDHGTAEVDHILPLSAAWDLGAHRWTPAERIRFANDPENLVLVSREQNQLKSDQLPSQWLPEDRTVRCWYVEQLLSVAHRYQLPLPEEDIRVAQRQCGFAYFRWAG